ncbi:unnamed protein product [Lampetra fluviatilis]
MPAKKADAKRRGNKQAADSQEAGRAKGKPTDEAKERQKESNAKEKKKAESKVPGKPEVKGDGKGPPEKKGREPRNKGKADTAPVKEATKSRADPPAKKGDKGKPLKRDDQRDGKAEVGRPNKGRGGNSEVGNGKNVRSDVRRGGKNVPTKLNKVESVQSESEDSEREGSEQEEKLQGVSNKDIGSNSSSESSSSDDDEDDDNNEPPSKSERALARNLKGASKAIVGMQFTKNVKGKVVKRSGWVNPIMRTFRFLISLGRRRPPAGHPDDNTEDDSEDESEDDNEEESNGKNRDQDEEETKVGATAHRAFASKARLAVNLESAAKPGQKKKTAGQFAAKAKAAKLAFATPKSREANKVKTKTSGKFGLFARKTRAAQKLTSSLKQKKKRSGMFGRLSRLVRQTRTAQKMVINSNKPAAETQKPPDKKFGKFAKRAKTAQMLVIGKKPSTKKGKLKSWVMNRTSVMGQFLGAMTKRVSTKKKGKMNLGKVSKTIGIFRKKSAKAQLEGPLPWAEMRNYAGVKCLGSGRKHRDSGRHLAPDSGSRSNSGKFVLSSMMRSVYSQDQGEYLKEDNRRTRSGSRRSHSTMPKHLDDEYPYDDFEEDERMRYHHHHQGSYRSVSSARQRIDMEQYGTSQRERERRRPHPGSSRPGQSKHSGYHTSSRMERFREEDEDGGWVESWSEGDDAEEEEDDDGFNARGGGNSFAMPRANRTRQSGRMQQELISADVHTHWARAPASGSGDDRYSNYGDTGLPGNTSDNLAKWTVYRDRKPSYSASIQRPSSRRRRVTQEREKHTEKDYFSDELYSIMDPGTLRARDPGGEVGIEDLTQLDDLHEGAILLNLKKRYDSERIYTYIGSILLSLNPYRMYDIYSSEVVLLYDGKAMGENPPHLFSIANAAYMKMIDAKENQCILISGESGSGKTEATKLVLRYVAALNHTRKDNITQQILEATPLLESFGNAKTMRNDNSSRFGKYIQLFMEDGVINGAITSQYLLEKSRIVFQAKNERNYHIFYELLAGLPSQQRQRYYLQDPETYYYLNQGGNCEIPGKHDGEDFRRLLSALEILTFSTDDQATIFKVLSSILHLGNVCFACHEVDGQEVASVVSVRELQSVSELLQISQEGLQKAITYKVTEAMREKIYTPLSVESAIDARDAIAKILYAQLFVWLISHINLLVAPRQDAKSIAVLDIYGFEDLAMNSFEQLCINYANEYLQYFFNRIIFRQEQEVYDRERISWKHITFNDNQACLDLISQKPYGIMRILDDQSAFPQATDQTFLQKCHYHHGNNPLYSKPKMPLPEFTIKHYAGKVTYQVHKFLDKNFDQVRQEVLELLIHSKCKLMSDQFRQHQSVAQGRMGKNCSLGRRYQAPTVAAKFQQSLMELIEKMEKCNPFFVRCIKPNHRKEPGLFDAEVVGAQLLYLGILETIRIRKEGYPVRVAFHTFTARYKMLVGRKEAVVSGREGCVTILSKISIKKHMDEPYQIGINRVFLKEKLHQALESRRERVLHWAAVTMQRYVRGFVARRRYHRMRSKVILLQAHIRGYQARYRYKMIREGFIRLRATVLMFLCRRRYLKARDDDRRRAEMEGKSWKAGPRREGVNVSQLEIPAELAAILQASRELQHVHDGHVVITCQPPISQTLQPTLPLDVNNFPFSKFARIHFKDQQFGVLTSSPRSPITLLEEDLRSEAVELLKLVMRFMGSSDLDSLHEFLFGCYVVQRGLACVRLRDELLCQLANQTWHNEQPREEEQGWLLMAACLSSFSPSPRLEKYLLKYVSDHAYNGYRATCQHKLLQGMSANSVEPGASRTFPPCLLEWVAAKNHAAMALEVACYNGETLLCPVESWTTGEQLGASILQRRGASESCRGWSVSLQQGARTNELPGHEHVLDLVSHLELPPSFPTQTCSFLPPQHNSGHGKDSSGGSAYETDEDMPFPPRAKAPPHPPASLSDSDGYFSRPYSPESETNSDQRSQKTMDQYLDSLFDPVLSFGAADMERAAALSRQLKGGGRVGPGASSQPNPQAAGPPPQQTPAMVMSPDVMAQQQALLQQQAYLLVSACDAANKTGYTPAVRFTERAALGTLLSLCAPLSRGSVVKQAQQMALQMMYQHKPGSEPNAATSSPAAAGDGNNAAAGVAEVNGEWEGRMRPLQLSRDYRPEPTQNIRNIIKEFHTQPATTLAPPAEPQAGLARGTGKAFVKKPDPHMEAMAILQMKPRAPDIHGCGHALQRKRSQIAEARAALGSREDPPAFKPPPPPFSDSRRSMKKEDSGLCPIEPEEERVETQLHQLPTDHTYIYSKVPWKILLRKEVFYPKESLNNPMVVNLLFKQVVHDTFSATCLRITPGEREKMKSMLADCRVGPDASSADELLKKRVIMAARDNWATYFARLFPATGSAGTEVQMLGVSHKGVKLLAPHRARPSDPPQLRVLHSYSYADVLFVTLLDAKTLEFMLSRDKLLLFSPKAAHVKAMVDHFITELKKDSNYVVAVRSYSTEDRSLLSFHKGDLIKLLPLDGLEPGWRFGMRNGRSGLFPAEYVTPAAPPEYEHLSDRPTGALSAAGSNVADLDRGIETSSVASEYTDSLDDCMSVASEDGGYTMLDFAKKFFREAQANQNGARGKLRKEKAPTDPSEMVKYTKSPIQESLIHSQDPKFNKLAVEAFLAVMKFMGDYPLKGQGEVDSVFSLLKFSENQPEMRDEIYCHIVKQITSNKSPKPDSCHRGWRLLYIVTAYSKCSDNLKPYLLRYLREVANDSKASFQGMARVCEQHLRRTLQMGGRTHLPSSMELKALVAGRNSKRQLILLPGAIERHVKIKTNSTVQDVIEEICQEMGLHRQEAQEEFAIFLVTNRGESVRPLQKKEYILDVSSEAEKVDEMHRFWFRRIVWVRPLKFDNELYISMHFNQILPEYMNGLFLVLTAGRIDDQLTQQVAKLAALQHRIKGSDYQPTQREVGEYIPAQVLRMQRPQSWLGVVLQHSAQVQALSAHQARAQFMGLASALPLFGSAFFFVQSSSNTAITTPCILAVNQQGLSFLNSITHEVLVSFPMQEVQSTRTQRPTQGETIPYVEIMLGNLMSQRIMQLQLQQGMELCRVIAMHQEILLAAREKRHSLPPSDITIL